MGPWSNFSTYVNIEGIFSDKNIDEVEYEAPRTARDEDREKHLAEMEEQR